MRSIFTAHQESQLTSRRNSHFMIVTVLGANRRTKTVTIMLGHIPAQR